MNEYELEVLKRVKHRCRIGRIASKLILNTPDNIKAKTNIFNFSHLFSNFAAYISSINFLLYYETDY